MPSASSRTISAFQAAGFRIESCEKWVRNDKHPAGGVRRDLFGCLDYIAIRPGLVVGVQSTTGNGASSHVKKIVGEKRAAEWLLTGCPLVMLAWRTLKGQGQQARVMRFHLAEGLITHTEHETLRTAIPEMLVTP